MPALILHLEVERGFAPKELERIRDAIVNGMIFIFPTDTIYGLGCDAKSASAVKRIYELKGRPPERPFSVHLGSIWEIEHHAELTERQRLLIEKLLPGPFTVVLKAASKAPPACVSPDGKIGLRVPKSRSFRLVYQTAGRPLVGTSVNRSGEPPLINIEEIRQQFADHVELIIATDEPMTQESSSVIDLTVEPPVALRGRLPAGLLG